MCAASPSKPSLSSASSFGPAVRPRFALGSFGGSSSISASLQHAFTSASLATSAASCSSPL
eukprot:15419795-Alexandrium_andersonii.AAC.1